VGATYVPDVGEDGRVHGFAEMVPRVFELFVQGDQSLAHTSGGLGIGLTLVRRLIELHRGRVEVHSSLRTLLEHEGYRVDEMADGASGLDRAEATQPDIVLIDIGLPGLDGYEVARRIRSRRGAAPILVAITGYGQADDRRLGVEAGFDAHLTKPVSPDHLVGVLAGLRCRGA
jgi:CheY-like chemotaxis protein